jgi:hypothetical protein
MTYRFEDPAEERDHLMPWGQIATALLFSALVLVVLAPVLAVLWLFSAPKSADEPPPPNGTATA